MVKYKVNLKFKDPGNPLNEIITEVLKIELQKKIKIACNIMKRDNYTHYSLDEGGVLISDRE